ncbi:Putative GTP-binding protein, ribosome biogenesis, YsxC [Septoria linicola]|uniref:GTP-binding protein 8 n=1 Tax=Septoria linicola TaxID=215465 RepID=A0A9Q9ATR1_9PEZI|nr:putative GTP-binding protein, ribosome biogenesis, YsxC [Septoria linicola]USW52375.1 Putative GTP-binding protein, ribosome biogenesis, YsxC [Septoria linicola]
MDFLRLPSTLRRSLVSQPRIAQALLRHVATTPNPPLDNTSEPQKLLKLSPETLNSYTVSHPPLTSDLPKARSFFTKHHPELLFTSASFRALPPSPFPEVAFLGRSNVGKSSLLNALFGRPHSDIARVSKKPGKTRTINGFGVGGEGLVGAKAKAPARDSTGQEVSTKSEAWKRWGRGGLLVVDMPGYGSGSREEWGGEIMKYLENRKQLRRTYVLVDSQHGLKKTDVQLLVHLRKQGIAHQVVLSKVDKLLYPDSKSPGPLRLHNGLVKLKARCEEIRQELDEAAAEEGVRGKMGDLMCCSSEKSLDARNKTRRIGVDELRWSVLTACGLENTIDLRRATKVKVSDEEEPIVQEEREQYAPMQ